MSYSGSYLLNAIRRIHEYIRAEVCRACESQTFEELCGEANSAAGDTIYAIDRIAEAAFFDGVRTQIAHAGPIVLIGEGVENGCVVVPEGASESEAEWRLIVDPIDGTRSFMFQKRPAWILTGAAPNRGAATTLADIEIAVQTELPLVKQHLCDTFWATKGEGVDATRTNRLMGECEHFDVQPSSATTLVHGYGTVCSFFAGGRDVLGRIADELSRRLLAGNERGEARIFEDQYASTGGQIAGLLTGQDRFVADLRPLLLETLNKRGEVLGHCCHPYDLCTKLIAEEAGVEICSLGSDEVNVPLDTETNVAWVGYANQKLRNEVEPLLERVVRDILG